MNLWKRHMKSLEVISNNTATSLSIYADIACKFAGVSLKSSFSEIFNFDVVRIRDTESSGSIMQTEARSQNGVTFRWRKRQRPRDFVWQTEEATFNNSECTLDLNHCFAMSKIVFTFPFGFGMQKGGLEVRSEYKAAVSTNSPFSNLPFIKVLLLKMKASWQLPGYFVTTWRNIFSASQTAMTLRECQPFQLKKTCLFSAGDLMAIWIPSKHPITFGKSANSKKGSAETYCCMSSGKVMESCNDFAMNARETLCSMRLMLAFETPKFSCRFEYKQAVRSLSA